MAAWLGRMPWAVVWLFLGANVSAMTPTAVQLRGWASQLDADDFVTRETAERQLIAAGEAAVGVLSDTIVSGSPEAAWRASSALQQITLCADDAAQERVVAALKQLRYRDKPGLAGIVAELSVKRARLRHLRAVAQIQSLGGKFNVDVSAEHVAADTPVVSAPQTIVSDEEKLSANLEEPAGIGALDVALQAIDGLVSIQVPAPPPDLPHNAVIPGVAPMPEIGETLIGDAFVSPELEEAGKREKPVESLTLDQSWRGGDQGIASLRDVPSIVALNLRRPPLSDAALQHIAAMPRLRSLTIDSTPFTAAALRRYQEQQPQVQVSVRGQAMLRVNADVRAQAVNR